MDSADEIKRLLAEIRDAQREHLAEYRRMAERSVALQERAVARQEQVSRIYKAALLVGGFLVLSLLLVLADLIGWL
ncbi:MAG: hypothetical protein ACREQZ_02485 [Woeseiaceae bacterium]